MHLDADYRAPCTEVRDKDVVVIGTGASAAQMVPALLKEPFKARSVTQVMRTPPWVMPRIKEPFGEETYARWAPVVLGRIPLLGWIMRISINLLAEVIWQALFLLRNVKWRSHIESNLLERMRASIPEKYHEIMTPDYPYGCKRRVFDDEWLASMSDPNFELTTERISHLKQDGLVLGPDHMYPREQRKATSQGRFIHADMIVLANGFDSASWTHPVTVYGKHIRSMQEIWKERGGPQAYMGTALDGFPNFFMVVGPNSANGHASLLTSIEFTIDLILRIADPVLRGFATHVEPKTDACLRWTRDCQTDIKKTVFTTCHSWYQNANGFNSTMYPYVKDFLPCPCGPQNLQRTNARVDDPRPTWQ